jgi:hypothetical protein
MAMIVGRSSNRWLGRVPGVVAVIATIGFGVPAYAQHTTTGGGAGVHMSAPAPRPPMMTHPMPAATRVQPPPAHEQQLQQPQVRVQGAPQQQQQQPQVRVQGAPQQQQQQEQQPQAPVATEPPRENGDVFSRSQNGGQFNGGGQVGGQGLPTATNVHPRVPHPPTTRRWPLPQGATEADRPPPGQCRVWLSGVPGSRQPAPTSCGQAAKMRTPGSTLIFGDDKP